MALILNIDTATEKAGVCLTKDGEVLFELQHEDQKNHAAFVQPAIQTIVQETGIPLQALDAIAVTAGPGSYTGLRVGLATAKGLCFTLSKPLIMINTLEVMAKAASAISHLSSVLLCPMIDARRLEVFTALYNTALQEVSPPAALILTEHSFEEYLDKQPMLFTGSGHKKFQALLQHQNAFFSEVEHRPADLGALATLAFHENRVSDLAYSEPFYLKEFFTPAFNTLKPV